MSTPSLPSAVVAVKDVVVVRSEAALDVRPEDVAAARVRCAAAMRGVLHGDLAQVHPFVTSLMHMLTLGMPDAHDKTAFVEHVASRTTCVLGDLFALAYADEDRRSIATGGKDNTSLKEDASLDEDPPPVWRLLRFPLWISFGAVVAHRITFPALLAGCVSHPAVAHRIGLPWCVLALVFLIRTMSCNVVASFLVGMLSVDAHLDFTLLRSCTGGLRKS